MSKWYTSVWKMVVALSVVFGLIASALQLFGKVDFYRLLIVPLYNFFTILIPLYSIPLTFIAVIVILLILTNAGRSRTVSSSGTVSPPSSSFDNSDILDMEYIRRMTLLCQTPQTTDFLRQMYQEFRQMFHISGGYSFEDCLKQLEHRGLIIFHGGKWYVTNKALDYIAKYHG